MQYAARDDERNRRQQTLASLAFKRDANRHQACCVA